MIERVADQVFIPLTVGGGVRRVEDVRKLLNAGADKVSINTSAVENPELVEESARRFGSQAIVVAIDARAARARRLGGLHARRAQGARARRGRMGARRWPRAARARSCSPAWTATAPRAASTSTLTRAVSEAVPVPVIASGGVGTLEHLAQGIEEGRADAVLAASVFHFGEITIPEAKRFLAARGIEMRL